MATLTVPVRHPLLKSNQPELFQHNQIHLLHCFSQDQECPWQELHNLELHHLEQILTRHGFNLFWVESKCLHLVRLAQHLQCHLKNDIKNS